MAKTEEPNLKLLPCNKKMYFTYAEAFFRFGIFVFLFFLSPTYFTQNHSTIHFKKLALNDGLSQSSVNCITQDPFGFLWFGTQDGLNQYDGYTFKIFQHDLANKQSLSNNFIHSITATHDSLLLIGTERGLNLYNPFTNRFTYFFEDKNSGLNHNNIWSVLKTNKNQYWIGTEKGLLHFNYTEKKFTEINLSPLTGKNLKIRSLFEDSKNRIWIATEGNGIYCYNPTSQEIIHLLANTNNNVLRNNHVWSITETEKNTFWIGTNSGLDIYYENLNKFEHFNELKLNPNSSESTIKSLFNDHNGNLWIGTNGAGVFKYNLKYKNIVSFKHNNTLLHTISNNVILSFYKDFTGSVWIGTEVGINKFDINKQFFNLYQKRADNENSLSNNLIWSVFKDKNTIYVGTDEGLDKINALTKKITNHTIPLTNKNLQAKKGIYSIYRDSKNILWTGTDLGLHFFDEQQEKIIPFHLNSKFIELTHRVYSIYEDRNHYLWIGTKEGLILINPARNQHFLYQQLENTILGLSGNTIRTIKKDKKGNIWLGIDNGGLCKAIVQNADYSNIQFKAFTHQFENPSSISNNTVLSIHVDKQGILWIGTFGGGLNKFNPTTEKFESITQKDGLANNVVYGVLEDKEQQLWLSTNRGICRYDKNSKHFLNFEQNDGLQSNEFNVGAYFASNDGEFFFGGINGLNSFYPSEIQKNLIPPKINITGFYLFNNPITENHKIINGSFLKEAQINLNYKQNVISIEYAGLHYSYSEKNNYQYKLEGFDENWINAGTERKANFTNLDPGEYIFMVRACNSDGIWSKETAQLKIIVTPPIWKTWWFKITGICIILLTIYVIYKVRLNAIEAQKLELEWQVQQRTAEIIKQKEKIEEQKRLLEVEKNKVEKLLLNILPEDTVEELKSKGKASARSYRTVSVMFTDFKGFTKLAEKFRPKELLTELDSYFIKFDEIIQKYNIEKIKTMGDSYMCAGGIPIRNKSNPIDIVLSGLEIQRYIQEIKKIKGENAWSLRIGINTGELIAGVVGIKRFAYDIWGDTVNIASRMESSGEEDKVNISGATYEHIKDFFVCEYRGKVKAKNKGFIDMYFVNSIKPELSVNGEGIEPNENFWKYVNLILYSSINYRKAEKFILKMLEEKLPSNLHYHSIAHTKDVCQAIERIALMEGVVGEELFLLKTAALYHDSGFVQQYETNEAIGADMAKEALHQFGYTQEQIEIVQQLILATKVPQQPQNHLEQIICDADLDYLGRDDFHSIADNLKLELLERNKIQNDKQWDEIQIKFLEAHHYFTPSAIQLRQDKKLKNIEEIKNRLANYTN
ncbi:MAG: HD domain-containing protein [Bacteroidetes bacterium]|nr:HD domain-containing protein [Bacteroidota bacterium]NOG94812.1 HD domain-containing protein [Bacteroidota bacterium]